MCRSCTACEACAACAAAYSCLSWLNGGPGRRNTRRSGGRGALTPRPHRNACTCCAGPFPRLRVIRSEQPRTSCRLGLFSLFGACTSNIFGVFVGCACTTQYSLIHAPNVACVSEFLLGANTIQPRAPRGQDGHGGGQRHWEQAGLMTGELASVSS